jgi:hypothetical protein
MSRAWPSSARAPTVRATTNASSARPTASRNGAASINDWAYSARTRARLADGSAGRIRTASSKAARQPGSSPVAQRSPPNRMSSSATRTGSMAGSSWSSAVVSSASARWLRPEADAASAVLVSSSAWSSPAARPGSVTCSHSWRARS